MKAHKIARTAQIGITLLLLAATPALAQSTVDPNCNPLNPGSDAAFGVDVCRSHLGCDITYRSGATGCKFLNSVAKAFSAKGRIDSDDVVEAEKPPEADTMTPSMSKHADTMTAEQRKVRDAEDHERQLRNSNAANDGPGFTPDQTVLPPKRPGGYISVFEGSGTPKDGQGTLIGDDGAAKGDFKNGKLQGEGEQILADGTYRGGNYKDGQIAGKGFEFGMKDGKTAVTEGTFKADEPDGLALVTYEDKSSERVRWENGKIIARGPRAAPGVVPDFLKPMSDIELAIAGHQPTDVVIGNLVNGTGMIERVRKDGTAQFEEWEDGQIVQVGVRKNKADALAPQQRPKAAPHHFNGNGPAPPEEPHVVANPDPCRNERQEWASHYQGHALTEISGISRANERNMFLTQAIDTNEVDRLMSTYRQRSADPMRDPEFLRQVGEIEHRAIATVDQQMAGSTPEENKTWNRSGDRAGYAWVACMADSFARELQAHRTAPPNGPSPEKAPRPDPNVLYCRTEAEELLATIDASNPNRSSWTPILTIKGARDTFLDRIPSTYPGMNVVMQFHLDYNSVKSQAGIGNRAFLLAIHDAYSRPESNWSEEFWHRHDLWIACWALAEAKRLN